MKKPSKKTKQILSLAMIGAIGTSVAFASPDSVSAAQINPTQVNAQKPGSVSISDWKVPIQQTYQMYKKRQPKLFLSKEVIIKNPKIYNSYVEADGSPTITDSKSLFVGKSILTNNSNKEQTLTTNQFSKTFESSVTNSTTHGFNLGVSTSASFGIPLIGETNVQISTEYNFSNTVEKRKAESYTYTASPQNIVVPANSSVEVLVSLNTSKISGNVNLLTHVDGTLYFNTNPNNPGSMRVMGLKPFLSSFGSIDKNIKPHPQNGAYVIGKGKYSAEYGSDFSVTVSPINKPNVASTKLSESANEGYTYTVKPEVKKEQ
ncbi:ETX/MTX2 family pore-forming toxin (plasmid) [Bacillus toyonensis]